MERSKNKPLPGGRPGLYLIRSVVPLTTLLICRNFGMEVPVVIKVGVANTALGRGLATRDYP